MSVPSPSVEQYPARACRDDVVWAYRFFLGRNPETEWSRVHKLGVEWPTLIKDFIGSAEFLVRVRDRILSLDRPIGDLFDSPPESSLCHWVARCVPLSDDARARVATATSWTDLHLLVFSDAVFRLAIRPDTSLRPPFLAKLEALRGLHRMADREPSLIAPRWVLVTGAPRSGTSLLREMLDRHPNVALLQEYGLTVLIDRIDAIVRRPAIQHIDWDEKGEAGDFAQVAAFYRDHPGRKPDAFDEGQYNLGTFDAVAAAVIAAIAPGKTLRIVGDKMPMAAPWEDAPRLIERLHGLKFLIVIRNPAEVVKSSLIRRAATDRGRDNWPIRSVQEAMKEWIAAWHLTGSLKARYPNIVHVLKYEDLCSDPASALSRVNEFLGIPVHMPDTPIAVRPAELALLTPVEKRMLDHFLGPIIEAWHSSTPDDLMGTHGRLTPPYLFGKTLRFEQDETEVYLVSGFFAATALGRWMNGARARIKLPHGETGGLLLIELWVARAALDDHETCDVALHASGSPPRLFTFEADGGRAAFVVRVADAQEPGTLSIELTVARPKRLSVCVEALRVTHLASAQMAG